MDQQPQFEEKGNHATCFTCRHLAHTELCGTVNVIEFNSRTQL